jgi:hypothetical protein
MDFGQPMLKRITAHWMVLVFVVLCLSNLSVAQSAEIQGLGGTLVVSVPVSEGLVTCSDKRLFNDHTGTFNDDFVKIRKVNNHTLFVATHTIGFLDKTTGKMEFDVFEITAKYAVQHDLNNRQFWDGLKSEIRKQLLAYLGKRKFLDWPETDVANNKLLFNLVFYSAARPSVRSYSLSVFYEKAKTPVIYTPGMISQQVKTPQVIGKGKEVMDYLALNPNVAGDPAILRFDESHFDIKKITVVDAVNFARKLFVLTNSALPQARVSSSYDCALLSYQNGFQLIDDSGNSILQKPDR